MSHEIRIYSDDVLGKTSIQVHTRTHVGVLLFRNADLRQRKYRPATFVALKRKDAIPITHYVRPRDPYETGEVPTRISRNLKVLFRQLFEANGYSISDVHRGTHEDAEAMRVA